MGIRFKTIDIFFWQAVVAVVIAQFLLCYEAMTCRGYPPMTTFALNKLLISPLLVFLPAIFGSRVNRMRGVIVMSISLALFLNMVYWNFHSARPHVGWTHGPIGVVESFGIVLLLLTVLSFPPVFAASYFLERVAGDTWRALTLQPNDKMTFKETWQRAWGRDPS